MYDYFTICLVSNSKNRYLMKVTILYKQEFKTISKNIDFSLALLCQGVFRKEKIISVLIYFCEILPLYAKQKSKTRRNIADAINLFFIYIVWPKKKIFKIKKNQLFRSYFIEVAPKGLRAFFGFFGLACSYDKSIFRGKNEFSTKTQKTWL